MKILNLLKNYKNNKTNNGLGKNSTQSNWILKRVILHIVWGVLNIVGLIYFSRLIANTRWEYLFISIGVLYCVLYWIIATKIFDKLIGDEIDNLKRWEA